MSKSCPRVESGRVLMKGNLKDGGIVIVDLLCAVGMMDIHVYYKHPLNAMGVFEVFDGDGNIIEKTKS